MAGRKNTFWKEVAEACPELVGRELYLRFGMASPSERKFILLSGGRIQDFHTQRTVDSRKEWIELLKEVVPEVKELDEKSCSKWCPQKNVYTLPGRRGWRMDRILKYIKMNKDKAVNADIFFQPYNQSHGHPVKHKLQNSCCGSNSPGRAKRTRRSAEPSEKEASEREEQGTKNLKHQPRKKKRQEKRAENKESEASLQEKENTGDENVQQIHLSLTETCSSAEDKEGESAVMEKETTGGQNLQETLLILAETCSSALNKEYETSLQEKEKTGDENPQQTHCRTANGDNEMYSTNAGRDVLESHSYASFGPSKAPSFPPTSDADGTTFRDGGSLLPEELVLYGLLYVNGTYDPFTPQAGGGFASVATVANRITASSSYSSEGIHSYLSTARSATNQHKVGLNEGELRWVYFKSKVLQFVEKQGQMLRRLLSYAHNIDQFRSATIEEIQETAMAICENRSEPTHPPSATDAPYTLQSLQEDWKKELRDQWENWHLSYKQRTGLNVQLSEVFFHFHSPTDPSSPACDKTLQVLQDMTWTLKVQGRTASTEAWELPRTICQQSDIQTVLKFIQVRGVVCDGCNYEKYDEMVQRSFPSGIFKGKDSKTVMAKVESFGGQKCIRSQQCVLFFTSNRSTYDMYTSARRNICDFCKRHSTTLNSMLSRYNIRKTTKTSIYTNIKYLPRAALEKQLADTRQNVRVLQNTCGKLQAELTKCSDTNKPDTSSNVTASHVPGVSAGNEPAGHTPMGIMEQSTSDKPRTKKVAQPKANKSSTSHPKDPALHTPRKKVARSKAKKPSASSRKKPASATPVRSVEQSTATKPSIKIVKTMEQAIAEASISNLDVPTSHTPMMGMEQSDLPSIATPVVVEGVDDLYTFCTYSTVNMSTLFD